jgi:hypothetical protein
MGIERKLAAGTLGVGLLLGAAPIVAAPTEPLIVTQLPDPDPNYVDPSSELKRRATAPANSADEHPTLDQAMQDFGRAIGQAAVIEQQATQARCRSAIPAQASTEQRYAWEAACTYRRH